jgi:glycosyltransferase involved in cell wall biosynthesis
VGSDPLVSVVLTVHNGARFVDRTLTRARNQTYPHLEIIVVDDGSIDASPQIIAAHAHEDQRIRVVRQENAGVTVARNRGVVEARGDLIAFLDHDDLWHSSIIQKQVARFDTCDDSTAVVYAWSCLIDREDRIISPISEPRFEGWVLAHMCRQNFIGNGSAAMIRRRAIEDVGGCDEALSGDLLGNADAQLYLRLSERYQFAVVPEVLVGYRLVTGSIADNHHRMIRSYRYVTAPFRARYPEHAASIDLQEKELIQWFCSRALFRRDYVGAAATLRELTRLDPLFAAYSAAFVAVRPFLMRVRHWRSGLPARFETLDAAEPGSRSNQPNVEASTNGRGGREP